jgi:hypothetical protein
VARGDDLAVDLQERHHTRLEARVGAQALEIARGLVAEAEVLADAHVLGLQRSHQHVVDEAVGAA